MIAATTRFGIHNSSWLEARAAGSWWTGGELLGTVSETMDLIGPYEDAGIE